MQTLNLVVHTENFLFIKAVIECFAFTTITIITYMWNTLKYILLIFLLHVLYIYFNAFTSPWKNFIFTLTFTFV